jgi:hypothetical protein
MIIRIRHLLALRPQVRDQALLDYLQLIALAPQPGQVDTQELRQRWGCSQSMVSRRLAAVAAAGLVDVTRGHGAYQVHAVSELEEVA